MQSVSIDEAMSVELAKLEANLRLVSNYSKLMHLTLIGIKAEECLSNIQEIKKYIELHEQPGIKLQPTTQAAIHY
jgi:hypothetical protein